MPLNGYVLVDKPAGPSSHAAVQQVRRALGIGGRRGTRAGHAGTLDPFATGLLVVLVGRATRLMPLVVGHDKRYEVQVRFGASSDTDDREGTLARSDAPRPGSEDVRAALSALATMTSQLPPAVSAIHVDGERAYRRVRRGETIVVPPRPVRYDHVELVRWIDGEDPIAVLDVRCATGTYMRALARDLGAMTGCPAHCAELRRLEVGAWSVDGAPAPTEASPEHVLDAIDLVEDLPQLRLDDRGLADIASGRRVSAPAGLSPAGTVALVAPDGSLAALGAITSDGTLVQPRSVLVDPAILP